ncbi:bundle-forming pilus protein BfpE [Escherichia coli]|nr:bundle-forming pilus protein BfpE [Escherichia coli]
MKEKLNRLLFTSKTRMRVFSKLSRYLSNGVPVTFALAELYKFTSDEGRKKDNPDAFALQRWLIAVRNGKTLAEAMEGWVPSDELSIISAGEISGNVHHALDDIIYMNDTKKKVKGALAGIIYPVVLLLTTCLYLHIFGTQVVPAFSGILPVEKWQGAGRTMYYLAVFVQNYLAITLLSVIMVILLILATLSRWTGRLRLFFDRFIPWSIYKTIIGCGFLLSLASLINAGIPVPEALRIIMKTASPWYKEKLVAIRYRMLNGDRNLGEALNSSGYIFPSKQMIMDLRSYSALGGFDEMLNKLSVQWQDDSVAYITKQMSVLKNVAIIIMGLVFMWIVSGMFSLQQQISDAARF